MNELRTPLFAANWKMNKRLSEVRDFVGTFETDMKELRTAGGYDFQVVIAPMALQIAELKAALRLPWIEVSTQNCGTTQFGAFTGELSPVVIQEMGCRWVICGHSERRHVYNETDDLIIARAKAALNEGLSVIYCIGEKLEERKSNQTMAVLEKQLTPLKQLREDQRKAVVIAYEPVWAIGTGENATAEQAQEAHQFIRGWLTQGWSDRLSSLTKILYGGSVKPENSASLVAQRDVDGLLVGGASLDAKQFAAVIHNGLKGNLR